MKKKEVECAYMQNAYKNRQLCNSQKDKKVRKV